MKPPFFFISRYDGTQKELLLDADTSKHIVQVLRMKPGEYINLTDGRGNLITCEIIDNHKKHCHVRAKEKNYREPGIKKVSIAISLLKNSKRFEWFLEKASEIGVNEIIPMICERTEKDKFRFDRMKQICMSAMLQSQQCWLPVLQVPVNFKEVVTKTKAPQKLIAHCVNEEKKSLSTCNSHASSLILIGPEGDFTLSEIKMALENGFEPVSLGKTRLRSETAGIVAATILCSLLF